MSSSVHTRTHTYAYVHIHTHARINTYTLGLKWMVNLLFGYPDANIYGYHTDSDIMLAMLAIN